MDDHNESCGCGQCSKPKPQPKQPKLVCPAWLLERKSGDGVAKLLAWYLRP